MQETLERAELQRLTLQIERDLVAQNHLAALLAHATTTIAGHRRDRRRLAVRLKPRDGARKNSR